MEEKVSELLENILGLLGMEGSFEVEEKDEAIFVSIDTEEPGKLIGKMGETLAALQLILNLALSRSVGL
jgi:predicted RNA-binding protein Jag